MTTIFYSWQSDLPNATNRGLIGESLDKACKVLSEDWQVDAAVDRDTEGISGAPDISEAILATIERSACFVGDVTLIAPYRWFPRLIGRWLSLADYAPNPNVLVELGYALHAIGTQRVLLVMNTVFGEPEELPFDLRKRRVLCYRAMPSQPPAEARKKLTAAFEPALREAVFAAATDRLLPPTKALLMRALIPFRGRKVGLWSALPEREDWRETQENYIRDFERCFRDAGWECVVSFDSPEKPIALGLVLYSFEGNKPPANPDFEPIVGALNAARLPFQMRRTRSVRAYGGGITTNDPVLYIGPVVR